MGGKGDMHRGVMNGERYMNSKEEQEHIRLPPLAAIARGVRSEAALLCRDGTIDA